MTERALDTPDRYICPKCENARFPMDAYQWKKGVRRKIQLLCDNEHHQNLARDTLYIAWEIENWKYWLESIPEGEAKERHTSEINASIEVLKYLNRVAEQEKFRKVDSHEWRRTLGDYLKSL